MVQHGPSSIRDWARSRVKRTPSAEERPGSTVERGRSNVERARCIVERARSTIEEAHTIIVAQRGVAQVKFFLLRGAVQL